MLRAIAKLRSEDRLMDLDHLIPYSALVGFESTRDGKAQLLTALRHRDSNIGNPKLPAVHGGVVGALMEHAAIIYLMAETDIQAIPKTINVSIDYLRPVKPKDTFARAIMIRQGRRIANMRIQAWQEAEDRPVAAAHAHFLLG